MSRPEVSVVMPFAGEEPAARAAMRELRALDLAPGDELILVDNTGSVAEADGVAVIPALGERSPAHARNTGAERAANEWILFLDADTDPRSGLLGAYFEQPIGADVGALAGEVVPAPESGTLASRYGAARSFLSQRTHLEHPYRPRAAAANLLVRRAAFVEVGGFYEGVRAAEDTDFSWRLQEAGWRLELRPEAWVEHHYRASVGELRRQWRGYAAGRAWLARRYEGFEPQSALTRALRRGRARVWGHAAAAEPSAPRRLVRGTPAVEVGRLERGRYLALDALLSVEELTGFALSNRPARYGDDARRGASVVVVADQFPALGDPLVELVSALDGARVEVASRPRAPDVEAARRLELAYLEDDGLAARKWALLALTVRHPLRSMLDCAASKEGDRPLSILAPAVRRLERDAGARVLALGGEPAQSTARRIARLAGRPLGELPDQPRRGAGRKLRPRRR